MYTLKIGTRGTFSVASFKEASAKYAEVRDASGEGASTFPMGKLYDGKILIAELSYKRQGVGAGPRARRHPPL